MSFVWKVQSWNLHLRMSLEVLVLSAGGYGHVPIPLFKQPEDWVENCLEETNMNNMNID